MKLNPIYVCRSFPDEKRYYKPEKETEYKNMRKAYIKRKFYESKEYKTFIKPGVEDVFYEHDHWFIRCHDRYYEPHDEEYIRTFSVHKAVINREPGLDFEEV